MREAQPIGVAQSEVSTMLWPNAQTGLSSSLIAVSLTVTTGALGHAEQSGFLGKFKYRRVEGLRLA
jgi:hypothetical protein